MEISDFKFLYISNIYIINNNINYCLLFIKKTFTIIITIINNVYIIYFTHFIYDFIFSLITFLKLNSQTKVFE